MTYSSLPIPATIAFLLVVLGLKPLVAVLRRRSILDVPVERSSHTIPTPKGAGVLIIPVVTITWVVSTATAAQGSAELSVIVLSACAILLMLLSWADDIHHLSPIWRLGMHFACAIAGTAMLADDALLFQGHVPFVVDRAAIVLTWVWFVNLFNFMDGIDGISAIETLVVTTGVLAVLGIEGHWGDEGLLGAVLIGAALGFLPWNWHPARVFLGDSGSAPLGFLLGWLLISIAVEGFWAAALILPGYYLADSGVTLVKRLLRGEKIWQAHREHAYQVAASTIGHARTSICVGIVGLALIATTLGVAAVGPAVGTVIGAVIACGFVSWLKRAAAGR